MTENTKSDLRFAARVVRQDAERVADSGALPDFSAWRRRFVADVLTDLAAGREPRQTVCRNVGDCPDRPVGQWSCPTCPQLRVPEDADRRIFIDIKFQEGVIPEVGVNGCSTEDVIDYLVETLQGFQDGPLRCRENACAITHLQEARMWLQERKRNRQVQGVDGTYQPHS